MSTEVLFVLNPTQNLDLSHTLVVYFFVLKHLRTSLTAVSGQENSFIS